MKRSRYIWFLMLSFWLALGLVSCDTASNTENPDHEYFVKYYGGEGNQYGVDMLALNDGTFLLLGNYTEGSANTDIYLVKVDAEGEIIWEVRIGDNVQIWDAKDIEPAIDGNFIVVADFKSGVGDGTDIKLLKISPTGELLDSVGFGTVAPDHAKTVTPVDDGSFVVVGTTELTDDWNGPAISNPDVGNFLHYRFDQNLDVYPESAWTRISGFGGRIDVAVKSIFFYTEPVPPDDEPVLTFYVFGYSENELFNDPETMGLYYFLQSRDGVSSNNLYPGKHTNDTQINFVLPAAQQFGGGFLTVGTTQDASGFSQIFVGKLINNLTFIGFDQDVVSPLYGELRLPNNNLEGVSAANSLIGEQGYLILGNEVRSTGATNIWLSKINQSNSILWSMTFGSEAEDDNAAAVVELPDGKIAILGTMGLADNQFKMAFIKLNTRGQFLP